MRRAVLCWIQFLMIFWKTMTTSGVTFVSAQDINEIKLMISDMDEKLEVNKNHFKQLEQVMQQTHERLNAIEGDIKDLRNTISNQISSLGEIVGTLESRVQSLLASLSSVQAKLEQGHSQEKLHDISETLEDFRQKNAKHLNVVQNYLVSNMDNITRSIENIARSRPHDCSEDGPEAFSPAPSQLVQPRDSSMSNSVDTFLEEISSAMDVDVDSNPAMEFRSTTGRKVNNHSTSDLLRKIWRKIMKPVNNVGKRFATLEENGYKLLNACLDTSSKMEKLEEFLMDTNKRCRTCTGLSEELGIVSQNVNVWLNNLEQRMSYHISLSEKLFDKVSEKSSVNVDKYDNEVETEPDKPAKMHILDCSELQKRGLTTNGIYSINLNHEEMSVYCDLSTRGGGWTVIQRRGSFEGQQTQNFNRNWESYKSGFGDLKSEFWLGNDNIHKLTVANDVKLLVQLEDFHGNQAYAEYSSFSVESETESYRLHVDGYEGNASDSLKAHNGKLFSTPDRINDEVDPCCSCAISFEGGWWFYACFESHLNGPYFPDPVDNGYFKGIIWEHWKGDYSLKASEMKIRPKQFQTKSSLWSDYYTDEVEDP